MPRRTDVIERILEAKRSKRLTYQEIAKALGRHAVWTAAACMGQATLSAEEARTLARVLELDPADAIVLTEPPSRGDLTDDVPSDPVLYRLHEINLVYGPAIKALIHEMFGDGIMSAIDFEIEIERVPDPKGDRVRLTYNGKFLPYRKW